MDWKIGEIRQVNGEWYQCLESSSCRCGYCDYDELGDCDKIACTSGERSDNKEVYFKKLEKVGEPYMVYGHIVQKYKFFHSPAIQIKGMSVLKTINSTNTIEIEIKQNEKDMEENKMYDAKEDIPEFDKVVDECLFGEDNPNLKPFDLEAAKAGKPVCTRDGRKARIICFDRVTNSTNEYTGHLIVLVTNPNGDEQSFYYTEKGNLAGEDEYDNHKWDLMMLPEKKEGWINVYKMKESTFGYITAYFDTEEKAKEDKEQLTGYVATVKINWEE